MTEKDFLNQLTRELRKLNEDTEPEIYKAQGRLSLAKERGSDVRANEAALHSLNLVVKMRKETLIPALEATSRWIERVDNDRKADRLISAWRRRTPLCRRRGTRVSCRAIRTL